MKNLLQFKMADGHLVDVQADNMTELNEFIVLNNARCFVTPDWTEAILSDGKGNIFDRMKNPHYKKD